MDTTVPARPRRSASRDERDATIHIRASTKTKELIESAAAAVGKSLSEFTLDSVRQRATDVLLDQRLFVLDPDQFSRFMQALDNPPPAGPKLKALMKRRPLWQK
ncbi:MAG: DUF1778 domain-containing protein [Pseudolabrys sp.]|nr:DUF1778 domain-containing protein [Pseudolabrys sp.]MDP2297691.1 DUF1778 domain-containing protein [Pseudolabrys sp.]